jgi:HEAT repeat protein
MAETPVQLAAQLCESDLQSRRTAAEKLSQLGEAARSAAAALAQAAGSDDEMIREYAVAALEGLGSPPPEQRDQLTALLASSSDDTVYWGVTLLGRLGPAAEGSAPALVKALSGHRSLAVRERAAKALAQLGTKDPSIIAALQTASQESSPRLAREARQALDALTN